MELLSDMSLFGNYKVKPLYYSQVVEWMHIHLFQINIDGPISSLVFLYVGMQ